MCRFLNPLLVARRAFTLVELIVVIVILGILMAIAVPAFMSMRDRGNDTSAISNLNVAYRTVAGFAAGSDIYAASPADLAAKLGASEPGMPTPVVAPNDPAVGGIQVDLHDEERTAHLCTVSATGTSFCLAMNALGQLETNSPFVSSRTVYRTWGRTLAAAACWLPTEEDGPGESCDAPTRALGGKGTKPTGGGDPGDLGEVDNGDTVPPVGFGGSPANIPNVADNDMSANAAVAVANHTITNPPPDGPFGGALSGSHSYFTTSDTGDIYFADVNMVIRRINVNTQTVEMAISRNPASGFPVTPTVGEDVEIANASVDKVKGMTWGGGRLWMLDLHKTTDLVYVRVFNPATGRIATVGSYPNPFTGTGTSISPTRMAYVPAEGALYFFNYRACANPGTNLMFKRFDVAAGTFTTMPELPDSWRPCSIAYDHTTKGLLMMAHKSIADPPSADVRSAIFDFDPVSNTLDRIVGGLENLYSSNEAVSDTQLSLDRWPVFSVSASGEVLYIEEGAVIETGKPVGTLVRKLDRQAGTLTRVWASNVQPLINRSSNDTEDAAVGGDGRLYFPTNIYPLTIAAVSLLP